MNANKTDITVVLDRSGSMHAIKTETEGGFDSFVKDQASAPGECNLTLVQFDDKYEVVHDGLDIKSVPALVLHPRGWTALYDAIGKAVRATGDRLAAMKEEDRPGHVVFVVITDGHENCSQEFKRNDIAKLIKHQSEVYSWQFIYLGSTIDAVEVAEGLQFTSGLAVKTGLTPEAVANTYQVTSAKLKTMRHSGISGQSVNAYTPEERLQVDDQK